MSFLRTVCCAAAVALMMLLPGPASASEPQATAARGCGNVKLAVGKSIVRAKNVRCADARKFVKAFLNRDCGETRDCNFRTVRFRGYRCVQGESAKLTKNSCTKGRKSISELHN